MPFLKTLSTIAALACLALAGTAQASPLTSPSGTPYTSTIKAEADMPLELLGEGEKGKFAIRCDQSLLEAKVESHTSTTAGGKVSSLTFGECNYPVTVKKAGSLTINAADQVFSSGAEIRIETPVGECLYTTNGTKIGTLTDSNATTGSALLDITEVDIPRTGGHYYCGPSGAWEGRYKVTTPSTLYMDPSSASTSPLTSPSGTPYASTIKAESAGTSLHGSFITVSCGKSTFEGKVESHSSTTASGKVSALTFSGCNYPVTVNNPGSLTVHSNATNRGTVTSSQAVITIDTSLGQCIFRTSTTDIGTLTDSSATGGNASLDIGGAVIPRTGGSFFCGSAGEWTGSYKVATPSTLYLEPESPFTSPSGTPYTSTIKAESKTTEFHGTFTTVSCTKSTLEGKVEKHGPGVAAGGKFSGFTFSGCNYPVTVLNPGSFELHPTSGGDGTLTWTGGEVTLQTSIASCLLKTAGTDIGTFTGGTPAKLDIPAATIPRTGHSFFCGSSVEWTGNYTVTTPSTLLID